MQASAWSNGRDTYGIRVGVPNRDEFFEKSWTEIEVEIDGQFHCFALTAGFWHHCPEFRDSGAPVIRDWLRRHRSLTWPPRQPPKAQLVPLGNRRFRLLPLK
jgi:hypothetical protein